VTATGCDPKGKVMDVKQIAKYLGLHKMTVYHMHKKRQLPTFMVGGSIRAYKDVLDSFFQRDRA
jgi:excisionase family DNA binding protein